MFHFRPNIKQTNPNSQILFVALISKSFEELREFSITWIPGILKSEVRETTVICAESLSLC